MSIIETTVHPFELAGLGRAPFRYIGPAHQDIAYGQAVVNSAEFRAGGAMLTTKPGGTCAYCGAYILNMFRVASSDGREFHVGSDCIARVGGQDLARKVAKVVTARRKAATDKRNAETIAAANELLIRQDVRASLSATPHPVSWRAGQGETLLHWYVWMLAHTGRAGQLRAANMLSASLTLERLAGESIS